MGVFSVVIDELEDALNAVLNQVDVTEQVKAGMTQQVNALVGQAWQGQGAEAFGTEVTEFVIDKVTELLGFSSEFTKGIRSAIEYLRMLDDLLGGLFGL